MRRAMLVVACLLVLGACDTEALETLEEQTGIIRIQARPNVCWSGAIGDSTKEGCGNKSFTIKGESIIVANAQKEAEKGRLTMILEMDGEEIDRATTTAAFGVVQVAEG